MSTNLPHHVRFTLLSVQRAFEQDRPQDLATILEDIQPVVDAAIAWGNRRVEAAKEYEIQPYRVALQGHAASETARLEALILDQRQRADTLQARADAQDREIEGLATQRDEARENNRQLRLDLEEARLVLAAEQGRPEGAPSEGWRWSNAERWWERWEGPTGNQRRTGVVSECGGQAGEHGWSFDDLRRGPIINKRTARSAMQAADKAQP